MNELSRFIERLTGASGLHAYLEDETWSVRGRLARAGFALLSLLILIGAGSILTGGVLLKPINLMRVSFQSVTVITAAAAMAFLFMQGGIDFSFMSVASLSCAVFAKLLQSGTPLPAAIIAGLAAAVLFGLINAAVVGFARIPGLLFTAITGILAQNAVNLILRGETVFIGIDSGLMNALINIFCAVSWIVSLAVLALAIVLCFSPRFSAAKSASGWKGAAGLRIGLPYLGSSALAGLAGIFFAFRLNAASPMFGQDWAHEVFFILFFSGVIFGNRAGNPVGILIAAIYLGLLNNAMSILGFDIFIQRVVALASATGAIFFNLAYEAIASWLYKSKKIAQAAA